MEDSKSLTAWQKSQQFIPGGVNSPVRNFSKVGSHPRFIARGAGSKIYDIDGNEYIDYVASWGPLVLGHAHPSVVDAISAIAANGTSFGAPTTLETELAEIIVNAVPSIEQVRLVNSGTEATMTAIRVARGYTGRDKIIKIDGCYHGHVDYLLAKAGSGVATFGLSDSGGVPEDFARNTLTVPFNDADAVRETIEANPDEIACLILEPIMGNMGIIPPRDGYLNELREITEAHGIVLIFDEVITGFRVAYGGAQSRYNVTPDMTCLGKIIGGGLPVGAYGGKRDIMRCVAPEGDVYQAGTLSGNPLAVTAGITTLKKLAEPGVYEQLENSAAALADGLAEATEEHNVDAWHSRVGSMLMLYFTPETVTDADGARTADTDRFQQYFWGLVERGVYVAPSQFEAGFVSLVHSEDDINKTVQAATQVLADL
ncbi:glutamate-1-semialdehyde-2,1-aminomutase [Candidatus Poribacteria bacterium]|nr:glutamate-1-semialdehyde-2,1-aminomutase [Candidatus Poribacteria bacterium]MYK17683.1 glutamate-1-semialdehyde-2,1-aminomutase [Candidatus Poribacteria bacterium]